MAMRMQVPELGFARAHPNLRPSPARHSGAGRNPV